ncbi:MAG: cysteine protease [Anaerophaga sp.]|nr:cysteine protease [Anaerophaga sp.]MDK2842483.1 hypothetical protein [Anaerophaga sp.]
MISVSGNFTYQELMHTGLSDYGLRFCCLKRWYRSEPWDFQRGEAEWKNGNLYFGVWTYNMDVKGL